VGPSYSVLVKPLGKKISRPRNRRNWLRIFSNLGFESVFNHRALLRVKYCTCRSKIVCLVSDWIKNE